MNILLCDDDSRMLEELRKLVSSFFEEKEIPVSYVLFPDGESAVSEMHSCDLAFVDVEMPGMNGLDVARQLQENNPVLIIFMVTSHPDYLDDAMDLDVFRYLAKPVNPDRLRRGLELALQKYAQQNQTILLDTTDSSSPVFTRDILYICIHGRGTRIRTTTKEYLSRTPLKQWVVQLNANLFAQSHNSYLVNLQNVLSLKKREVTLTVDDDNGIPIVVPVSQGKYAIFRKSFTRYLGGLK